MPKKILKFELIIILIIGLAIGVVLFISKDSNKDLEFINTPVNNEEEKQPSIYDSYNEEEMEYLNNLMGLEYYDESKIDRYLKYMENEKYTYKEVIRVVNTNNDLEYFEDAVAANIEDDFLILVNKYNVLKDDYVPKDLKTINTSYSYWGELREEAADAFYKMASDASKEGLKIINTSPYRSYEHQTKLYNRYVNSDGKEAADKYSARPGFSEHQTGLAVDVLTPTSTLGTFKNTKEFTWMINNSYKYGFILRYGKDMEYITGYTYEPWHYRYVGIEAAKIITENDLTFEEYYYYYVKKK